MCDPCVCVVAVVVAVVVGPRLPFLNSSGSGCGDGVVLAVFVVVGVVV